MDVLEIIDETGDGFNGLGRTNSFIYKAPAVPKAVSADLEAYWSLIPVPNQAFTEDRDRWEKMPNN